MNTAYSYRRFSSKQQMRGDSLRRQTALALEYCLKHSLTLSKESFEDLGVSAFRSGNSSDDAGLGQFLTALNEGKIETPCYLLVESLDRLSRDNLDAALTQFMNIIQAGVKIVTLFDNKTYQRGMDVVDYLTALISMQRANEESRVKSQRISSVWRNRKDNPNARKTKNCPFWLSVSDCRTFYEVNGAVSLVHRMYALAQSGLGSQVIAKMLNEDGLKSPRGLDWSDATVSRTLNSRTVLGEYQPHQRYNEAGERVDVPLGEPIKGFYPQVITEEEFYLTQSAIKSRSKSKNRGASKNFLNVIKGVGTCAHCGSGIRLKKQGGLYYLQCNKYHLGVCRKGKPLSFRFLEDWLREVWLTPEYTPITASGAPEVKELRKMESELDKVNQTLQKLVELLDDGDDVIFKRIQDKKEEKRTILDNMKSLKEAIAPYNISEEAKWRRFTLLKIAFMDGLSEETLKARGELSQLLNQLKGFEISLTELREAVFKVTNSDGSVTLYKSEPNPYQRYSPIFSKIWKKEPQAEA
ncbi:recombinase family protein [Vibrio vulnificus]|nr:recombinase family protein [Vibrio vulnificus]